MVPASFLARLPQLPLVEITQGVSDGGGGVNERFLGGQIDLGMGEVRNIAELPGDFSGKG